MKIEIKEEGGCELYSVYIDGKKYQDYPEMIIEIKEGYILIDGKEFDERV